MTRALWNAFASVRVPRSFSPRLAAGVRALGAAVEPAGSHRALMENVRQRLQPIGTALRTGSRSGGLGRLHLELLEADAEVATSNDRFVAMLQATQAARGALTARDALGPGLAELFDQITRDIANGDEAMIRGAVSSQHLVESLRLAERSIDENVPDEAAAYVDDAIAAAGSVEREVGDGLTAIESMLRRTDQAAGPQAVGLEAGDQPQAITDSPFDEGRSTHMRPETEQLLARHLPGWRGFHEVVIRVPNPITGEDDEELTVPPTKRERLLQIFAACPKGSYGYYAGMALAFVEAFVGSFAAANIDEFFATNVDKLVRPYDEQLNELLSGLETDYWRAQSGINYTAGLLLTRKLRSRIVAAVRSAHGLVAGGPVVPHDGVHTAVDLLRDTGDERTDKLVEWLDTLDWDGFDFEDGAEPRLRDIVAYYGLRAAATASTLLRGDGSVDEGERTHAVRVLEDVAAARPISCAAVALIPVRDFRAFARQGQAGRIGDHYEEIRRLLALPPTRRNLKAMAVIETAFWSSVRGSTAGWLMSARQRYGTLLTGREELLANLDPRARAQWHQILGPDD